jgi:hypothetical protein
MPMRRVLVRLRGAAVPAANPGPRAEGVRSLSHAGSIAHLHAAAHGGADPGAGLIEECGIRGRSVEGGDAGTATGRDEPFAPSRVSFGAAGGVHRRHDSAARSLVAAGACPPRAPRCLARLFDPEDACDPSASLRSDSGSRATESL